ncbi:hypothetical protein LTR84_004293 [Exophiala bonariae]|uniref:Aspartate racemase n=1 Tax=Exophiala bonariae TaxID=1690606 RepID=A0AAV9N4I4_9EURO|nr:hypothetical protein LTR84_004293 [Exophiala bonariae]
MKTVGLIGGFSWRTTALYYREINQHVASRLGGIHSADLLIRSIDYSDLAARVNAKDYNGMSKLLCRCGHDLKAARAQALVLCANVAHKAAEDLQASTRLPVLHIVDFTAQLIVDRGFKKVGLLATQAVMEEEFYIDRLRRFGLEIYVPDQHFRSDADRMIFDEMSKDRIPDDIKAKWHAAYMQLLQDHQIDCVILGCTELRLVFDQENQKVPTFETTTIHARGIAEWALGEVHAV